MTQFSIDDPRRLPRIPFGPNQGTAPDPQRLEIAEIRRRFAAPPTWSPEVIEDRPVGPALEPRMAAVLIPLLARPHGTSLLLTRRSDTLRHHRGQIAFPGGRLEIGESPIAAALRETEEEIGLSPSRIDVLGTLPEYRTGTGFHVVPVVAEVASEVAASDLVPAPSEVAEIFEVPLVFLMDPQNHQRRIVHWVDGERQRSRSFLAMPWRPDPEATDEYFIWGATAAMLRNFYRFLAA
ncbi:MAG: CoA pyrophosphatase [Burkholderiaceae bacterium]|jgi:8-oxo-dGTP pyrophosphatase MutT (NUDIX family)